MTMSGPPSGLPSEQDIARSVANAIHAHWGLFLFEGIVLMILGAAAIVVPQIATLAFTLVIGWVFLISGGVGLVTTFWMRNVPGGQGLAHVDERTPQLGIAVFPPFQGQGYGSALMTTALDAARAAGYHQVSLTVHPENPAIALYERCGFRHAGLRRTYHLMVAAL